MPLAKSQTVTLAGASPASASTSIVATSAGSLLDFDEFAVRADLVGATGGTLDVYLQRRIAAGMWTDWVHFPQLASGAAAVTYEVAIGPGSNAIEAAGTGNDSTASPALAANKCLGGHPGDAVRLVCVAGASTSAGAAQAVSIFARRRALG